MYAMESVTEELPVLSEDDAIELGLILARLAQARADLDKFLSAQHRSLTSVLREIAPVRDHI